MKTRYDRLTKLGEYLAKGKLHTNRFNIDRTFSSDHENKKKVTTGCLVAQLPAIFPEWKTKAALKEIHENRDGLLRTRLSKFFGLNDKEIQSLFSSMSGVTVMRQCVGQRGKPSTDSKSAGRVVLDFVKLSEAQKITDSFVTTMLSKGFTNIELSDCILTHCNQRK